MSPPRHQPKSRPTIIITKAVVLVFLKSSGKQNNAATSQDMFMGAVNLEKNNPHKIATSKIIIKLVRLTGLWRSILNVIIAKTRPKYLQYA